MTTSPTLIDPAPVAYQPGACNIGPAEIARRRRSGYVGVGAAGLLAVGLLVLDAPTAARWLVAVPLAVGAVGFLQAHFRFCAAYGLGGIRNFGPLGTVERVEDSADRRADRRRSLAIAGAGGLVGLLGAAAFVILPV